MHGPAMSSYERAVNAVETRLRSTEALESYFQLGKLRRDHGDFSAAERAYREVLKIGPDRSGAHIMLGVTLRDEERLDEAVHHYSVGLAIHPGIPAAQYNRAQIYSTLAREEEAIHGYRAAVHTEPTFALAQEMLGEALGARGRLAEAESALSRAAVALPQSAAGYYYSLGKLHFTHKQLDRSVQMHQHALALAPGFAYVHNDIGNALSDLTGRSSEVLHHYSEASRLMPSFAEAFSNVGTGLKERGELDAAAAQFARGIALKPTLCEAYKNLGSCHTETGRLRESVAAYEGALRINPQFWPALYALLDSKQFLCDWRGRPALLAVLQDHLEMLHTHRQVWHQLAHGVAWGCHAAAHAPAGVRPAGKLGVKWAPPLTRGRGVGGTPAGRHTSTLPCPCPYPPSDPTGPDQHPPRSAPALTSACTAASRRSTRSCGR